ncbi:MAG: glycosyltransferase family 4 protein [Chloroflexaceae bacterium]|nr:glycosyltransferase family 4 protein [Chloroflexaceae bacterium]
MRIGYLTYGLDRAPAGIGRYALELLRAMAAHSSHEFVLLTTERSDPHGLWQQFEHYPLPACRRLPALLTLGNVLLHAAARRYRLDVIHDSNGIAPFLGLAGQVRCGLVLYDAFAYTVPQQHNLLDNLRYRVHLPWAARRADVIFTLSRHAHHDLVRYLALPPERIRIVPGAVSAAFRPIPDGAERQAVLARYGIEPPYVLAVGGLSGRKNIARLLQAYAALQPHYPDLWLVIVGKPQWRTAAIMQTYEALRERARMLFVGYAADADLPALYSAAQLFVFPSLYEGFGLPPLEAMACGTPIITSNVSSLPEVVGDAALLVDPYNLAALTAAMQQVLDDAALAQRLRERGLARARLFTWGQAARTVLESYEQCM